MEIGGWVNVLSVSCWRLQWWVSNKKVYIVKCINLAGGKKIETAEKSIGICPHSVGRVWSKLARGGKNWRMKVKILEMVKMTKCVNFWRLGRNRCLKSTLVEFLHLHSSTKRLFHYQQKTSCSVNRWTFTNVHPKIVMFTSFDWEKHWYNQPFPVDWQREFSYLVRVPTALERLEIIRYCFFKIYSLALVVKNA